MRTSHVVRWAVSLSNGDTVHEGAGDYEEIQDDLSPWNRLQKHIENNALTITALWLWHPDGHRWVLPGAGGIDLRRAHSANPTSVSCFRAFKSFSDHTEDEVYTVARAEFGIAAVEMWVSEKDHRRSWVVVRDG